MSLRGSAARAWSSSDQSAGIWSSPRAWMRRSGFDPISSTACRRSCSASHADERARAVGVDPHLEPVPLEPAHQVMRAGRADRDRPGDGVRGRGGLDGHEAAHARATNADAVCIDAVDLGKEPGHPADVGERLRAHRVLRLPVPPLVVGHGRPAARGTGSPEVAVVLLSRPGAMEDHHRPPGRRGLRQPEHVGASFVNAHVRGPGNAPAHRVARYSSRRPLSPRRQVLSGGEAAALIPRYAGMIPAPSEWSVP